MNKRERIEFDIWGCRGSRSFLPADSSIANLTSCYSVTDGSSVFVLDAGRGLAALSTALKREPRFANVKRVHIFVTHSHLDHWEGLKDAEWFWRRDNGLEVKVYSSPQGLKAIERGYSHPSYVPLEVLGSGTTAAFETVEMEAGERCSIDGWTVEGFALNHFSGSGRGKRMLDTLGYKVSRRGGPALSYLSDHFPTPATEELEAEMTRDARLAVFDAQFDDVKNQAFGHGSQEHVAHVARKYPKALLLAGHHGPMYSDESLEATHRRHGGDTLDNFLLAREGDRYVWDAKAQRFVGQHAEPATLKRASGSGR